jgi:hypothetical protein
MFGEVTGESVLNAGRARGSPLLRRAASWSMVTRVLAALQQEKEAMEQRHAALADEVRKYLGNEVRLMNVMEKIVLRRS